MTIPINDSYPVAVLVQVKGNGTLGREEAMMAAVATARGVLVIKGAWTR
jgi:ribosomal protein S9